MIKGLIKLIILVVLIAAIFYFWQVFSGASKALSADQEQIRETYGLPAQFMITYLPRGSAENPQAVRSEVWYYPKHGKQVNFLAGELLAVEDFAEEIETVAATSLRPEEFDVYMDFDDVAVILGELNIERVEIPVLFEPGEVETYTSDQALFIIEGDFLTYFQTIGISAEEIIEEDTIESEEDSLTINEESFNFVKKSSVQTTQVLGEMDEWDLLEETNRILAEIDNDFASEQVGNTKDESTESKPKPKSSGGITTSFTIER